MFGAVFGDGEGHDEAVRADVHVIQQQDGHCEIIQRAGLPSLDLLARARDEPATHCAPARAAAFAGGYFAVGGPSPRPTNRSVSPNHF